MATKVHQCYGSKSKAKKVMKEFEKEYGKKEGKKIFFATSNKVCPLKKKRKKNSNSDLVPIKGIKVTKDGEIQLLANPSQLKKIKKLAKKLGGSLV
jgi:hypothetical protein